MPHVDKQQRTTLVNEDGKTPEELVKAEILRTRNREGNFRISSKFVVKLHEQFDFSGTAFDDMPKPGDEEPDEELCDLLEEAHDENPLLRHSKPLIAYLKSCPTLSATNFYGLMQGVQEGPLLDATNAQKLQVASLDYIAQTGTDRLLPEHWAVVKNQLDQSLCEDYEAAMKSGIKLKRWLKTKKQVLKLYVAAEHVDALLEADGDYAKTPQHVNVVVNATKTGRVMFKSAWTSCAKELFVKQMIKV